MRVLESLVVLALVLVSIQGLVDVFTAGENGYYCIKIPGIILTMNGTLLAFGEARMYSCSDYTWTDIVMKRSTDNGSTWSPLTVIYSNSTKEDFVVIGNSAVVQDRTTGVILLPFCRNNLEVMITRSYDDGLSWTFPSFIPNVVHPSWQWVGTGPPASLQLESGRIVVPSYHDPAPHYNDGEFSEGHVMISDDHGETWYLGGNMTFPDFPNECQGVDLGNNTLLINSRSFGNYRLQTISRDGGITFENTTVMKDLPEPLEGCEGSIIRHPNYPILFLTNPTSHPTPIRVNLTLHTSTTWGATWQPFSIIDNGPSAYSALVVLANQSVAVLYERAPPPPKLVFVPQHISFTVVWSPTEELND